MAGNRESVGRTLLVAAAVALVCSAMVSVAIYHLRPIQEAYAQVDRNRAILAAAGRLPTELDDSAIVDRYMELDVRVLDLSRRSFALDAPIGDARAYDHWALTEASPLTLETQGQQQPGQPALVPRYVPAYMVWENEVLQRLVLPVHGPGMWSTIYGYLALQGDFTTVAAMRIYRHGETAGIGDRIEDPKWLASWSGKQIYDESGRQLFDVARMSAPSPYQVNLITGASVSTESLGDIVRFWTGPQGYGPILSALRSSKIGLTPP